MGPLLAEKKHLIGWVPGKGPMNARGRLELTGAQHWSTLQRKRVLLITKQSMCPYSDITFKRTRPSSTSDYQDAIALFGESGSSMQHSHQKCIPSPITNSSHFLKSVCSAIIHILYHLGLIETQINSKFRMIISGSPLLWMHSLPIKGWLTSVTLNDCS